MGVLPQAANVYFPANVAAASELTLDELANLAQFYGIAFNGDEFNQRSQFEDFIKVGLIN